MIIKQYLDVIEGHKTQTRRMKDRYQVGRVYSVVPKMYKPTVWYRWVGDKLHVWHEEYSESQPQPLECDRAEWMPLQIKITEKRQEHVQDISWDDAVAEGITERQHGGYCCHLFPEDVWQNPINAYRNLWNAINTKKGLRWEDNPVIVVYTFELVK